MSSYDLIWRLIILLLFNNNNNLENGQKSED